MLKPFQVTESSSQLPMVQTLKVDNFKRLTLRHKRLSERCCVFDLWEVPSLVATLSFGIGELS